MAVHINTGKRDTVAQQGAWDVTDWTEDLSLDCDTDDANLGDNLGTLIKQLISLGVIQGSVTNK